jgi:thiol:disulfide interchange protein
LFSAPKGIIFSVVKTSISGLVLSASLLLLPVHAESRTWTNTEGVAIDAEYVKSDSDNVTLRLRNGKLTTFAQSKLSAADQTVIKDLKAKETAAPAATPEAKPAVDANRKAKWLTKMDKAQEQAKETGLPILVVFTGTSWCPYCIKLEKAVFSESAFDTFANQNLVLLKLDFGPGGTPNSKKDEALQKEYGVKGFPTYFLTDATGAKLAQGGYHDGINPEKFGEWVKKSAPKK